MDVYTLPELTYDPAALEPHLSAEIVSLHHDKHHATYVKAANTALDDLRAAREAEQWSSLPGIERALAFNLGGHVLHSIYWTNLSPDGGGEPDGELAAAIDDAFGSFASFKQLLTQTTVGVQGSGWGALSWDSLGNRLQVQQIGVHHENHVPGATPLLVIDAWEHAYYLQYKNVRPDYVSAIWNLFAWDDVAQRFAAARSAALSR
jgi:Fe-Mn family superoxide dismutase